MSLRSLALAISTVFLLPVSMPHAAAAGDDSWPATKEGVLAKGWVTAFCTGADSMRIFLDRNMAVRSLQERGTRVRVEKYRALREEYGKLQLTSVVKAKRGELTVKLMDTNAREREFIFTTQIAPPYQLISVSIREQRAGGHGMFGGFHH